MRLDCDCIRDILFEVEEKSTFSKNVRFPEDFSANLIQKYPSSGMLQYHIRQCYFSGLLIPAGAMDWDASGRTVIKDISPKAHEFLANIRQENAWNRVKTIAKGIGSFSLNALINIASGLVNDAVKSYFTSPR